MQPDDRIRLRHMLDAAREAASFAVGRSRDEVHRDRQLGLALVKLLEIIGEAVTKLGHDVKTDLHEIPWHEIASMRHRLIHAYHDIDFDRVWDTVIDDLPPLVEQLETRLIDDEH